MIKIGIYDRYLSTLGGGERYSCKLAEILSKQSGYSVDLITDIYADLKKVSSRLNLDLVRVNLKIFPFLSEEYAKKITSKYDIFINATYLSSLPGHGKRNIYLCYFPTPFDVDFKFIHRFLLLFFRLPALWLFRLADKLCNRFGEIEVEEGLYEPKRFLLGRGSWSSGEVHLRVKKVKKQEVVFRIGLKNPSTSNLDKMKVKVKVASDWIIDRKEGKFCYEKSIALDRGVKKIIEIPANFKQKSSRKEEKKTEEKYFSILITSDTFVPRIENSRLKDSRRLGVVVYDERKTNIIKKIILKILGYIPLFLVTFPKDFKFLDTYHKIIAISEYSKNWIKKLWGRDSVLLFPPVDVESFKVDSKEKIILSVGRFFPEHHNKKQLELAKVFIELLNDYPRVMNGYTLYLIGGVEERREHLEYVEKIKNISKNYPVKIITNIEWDKLLDIFSRAEIFWHGAGIGEDERKHPEKLEHFGITSVEAMASGCIPIVVNKGGQREIIKNGEDGFLFNSWQELKDITLKVCSGKVDTEAIKEKAIKSCRKFSNSNFEDKLLSIIESEVEEIRGRKL